MAKGRPKKSSAIDIQHRRPALTPEARENQLIALAMDAAEKRILEGTASSQEIIHFLKLGSTRGRLEKVKLQRETDLLMAKKESIESAAHTEEIYKNAIEAMKRYSGNTDESDDPNV